MNKIKKCKVCGRESKYELCNSCRGKERREKHKHDKCTHCEREGVYSKGLCYKHWKQLKDFGEFKDKNSRIKGDLNEIINKDGFAEIILYDNNYEEKCRAIIDIEDVDKVNFTSWYLDKNGYVVSKCKQTKNKGIYLHRLILNADKTDVVDHINHNTLDNRKENLRLCTQQENTFNTTNNRKNLNKDSEEKGIFKRSGKWEARIMYNYKNISLGRYINKEDAIKARKQAEIKYFGEFRNKLNN